MARRRATAERPRGPLVLPAHLADNRGLLPHEYPGFFAERRDWFAAHGIDPHDWRAVYPILRASWEAHNVTHKLRRRRLGVEIPRESTP